MKNATRIFLSYITAVIFLLSGCEKSDSTYQTEDEMRTQLGEDLMISLMKKDAEGVKSLLCPYFIENYEGLDDKIQGLCMIKSFFKNSKIILYLLSTRVIFENSYQLFQRW